MYPSDEARQIEFVKSWISAYEQLRPYVQFLQSLAPEDPKASWFVYEPDLHIELPQTFEKWGQYEVEISRSFRDSYEEFVLATAEAVYSSPSKMVDEVYRHLVFLGQEPPKEMAPLWGLRGNDSIQVPSVLTARAVRYYYDLARMARVNPQLPTGFHAEHIALKYDAVIKHFDQYSHNRDEFTNVYVADLTLQWSFGCGMLCGMGFIRNKLVVLDNKRQRYRYVPGFTGEFRIVGKLANKTRLVADAALKIWPPTALTCIAESFPLPFWEAGR